MLSISFKRSVNVFLLSFLFLSYFNTQAQTGPGGVGATNGSSNLVLWLKQDAGVEEAMSDAAEAGDLVEFWRDQSGYNHHLSQNTIGDRPTYNGSAIEFRGDATSNSNGTYMDLVSINAQTIIVVMENLTSSTGSTHGLFSQAHSGSSVYYHVTSNAAYGISFDGTLSEEGVFGINGENLSASEENHSSINLSSSELMLYGQYNNQISNFIYFGSLDNSGGPRYRGNYDIKEVIVYDNALSACERAQVEAYLIERYGLPEGDHFDESASGSNGIQTNIDGIKELGTSDITTATSGILSLTDAGFLSNYGDAIYIANNGQVGYESTDVPAGIEMRMETEWWADYTSCPNNAGNVLLSFDLSPLSPSSASTYRLLTSNSSTFTGATITTGAVLNGSSIEFTVPASLLNDVYFTFATTDVSNSELLAAPSDIFDGIQLWLMNDAGVEEAAGDAAEIGDAVEFWRDQSQNFNDASMTGTDKPSYTGDAIQFSGTATGNSIGDYFNLASLDAQTVITVVDNASDSTGDIQGILSNNAGNYLHFHTGGQSTGNSYSWDGTGAETGRLGLNGGSFSTAVENLSGTGISNELQLHYSEWTNPLSNMIILGGLSTGSSTIPNYIGNYQMKEILVYDRALTTCEKNRIETYLAAKHNIEDYIYYTAPSSAFTTNAASIYEGGVHGDAASDSSGILTIENIDFLTDFSDGIGFASHTEGGMSFDVPLGLAARLGAIWHLDYNSCDGNHGNIRLRFKLSGGDCINNSPAIAANYRLLHHSGTTMNAATAISGATIIGDYIEFTVNTTIVADQYISLATVDNTNSPLGIDGPANVVSGLNLWLKADCGVEEAIGDAAETGDPILRWKDQSGASNHASQEIVGEQPNFNGNAIEFRGDATSNNTGEYLNLDAVDGQTIIMVINNMTTSTGEIHGVLGQEYNGSAVYHHLQSNNDIISFDGTTTEQGVYAIDGAEFSSAEENHSNTGLSNGTFILVSQYNNLIDDFVYLGALANSNSGAQYRANYDMMEIIVYNRVLTCEERNDIEEYLANKYSTNLFYDRATNIGDNGINNNILTLEENNPSGTSSTALNLSNVSFINDCIDTLFVAHDGSTGILDQVSDPDMSGLAGTDVLRWARVWYSIYTANDDAPEDVRLEFDLDNYTSFNATGGNYALISRTTGAAWSYATVISGSTIDAVNNTVSFVVDVDDILNQEFTLALRDADILPIQLISFDAKAVDRSVELKWITEQEINNEYFDIERSPNAYDNWETIATVNAAGNSTEVIHYKHIDSRPLSGTSYYRLKQVDFDGSFSYSTIRVVNLEDNLMDGINVYPNPTRNGLNVQFGETVLNDTEATISIMNSQGQVVYRVDQVVNPNQVLYLDRIQELSSAVYILTIEINGKNTIHKRFVKH